MGELIRVSDTLIDAARITSSQGDCSVEEQIETWATLGRAVERLLAPPSAGESPADETLSLYKILSTIDSDEGHQRVRDYLQTQPYPYYEPVADNPRHFVRVKEDGTRTLGRFKGMRFEPLNDTESSSK